MSKCASIDHLTDSVLYQVTVTFDNGEKLILNCGDDWTAKESCNRCNLLPGVRHAVYETHGYSLFNSWESAMACASTMTPVRSDMSESYLAGKNPLA